MSSYDRHGYINKPHHAGIKVSVENEEGYINDQDLKSSEDYETPDYDSLNNSERGRDKHVYHGLDLKPDNTGTNKRRADPHPGFGNKDNDNPSYKKSGQRKFIVVVVILIVLLVALAATFGVLYFKRTETSSEGPVLEDSPETTQELSTPLTTISTTTSSSPSTTTETIEEMCQVFNGLIPHPQECQAYYNCSYHGFVDFWYTNFEPFLLECPYPQQFSTETMACEHFVDVDCGERKEAKQGCDYRAIRCAKVSHCEPCYSRYRPYCAGKEDGFHMREYYEWSPYYINCYKERFVAILRCPDGTPVFSPEYRGCVTLDRIPPEHGGYMPNCTGKEDGFHMHEQKEWSPYYIYCYKERFVAELRCPGEPIFGTQLFSPEYGGCVGLDRIPPEHGGMKPNCTGKEDGFYPNEYGKCDHYTECVFGQYKMIQACLESEVFDEATKRCSASPTSVCVCGKTGCEV